MKPALLVQDIQNAWLYDPDSNQDLRRSVEKRLSVINAAIAWFRKNEFPIIVGYTKDEEQALCRVRSRVKSRSPSMSTRGLFQGRNYRDSMRDS